MHPEDEDEAKALVNANRDKRPLYHPGQRVRVLRDAMYVGWEGEVRDMFAVQTITGLVATYMYHVRMDNLAIQVWDEDHLAGADDEPAIQE